MAFVRRLRQSPIINRACLPFTCSPFWSSDITSSDMPVTVTLIPGDGIGLEITDSVKQVFHTASVPILWNEFHVDIAGMQMVEPVIRNILSYEWYASICMNKLAVVGPNATADGKGHWQQLSVSHGSSLTIRKNIEFYANVWTYNSFPGYMTRYDDVNLVIIRENSEGECSGLEHLVVNGVAESIKIVTRHASTQVAEYAFHYARKNGHHKVSAIHKANIMHKTDGLFLSVFLNPPMFC